MTMTTVSILAEKHQGLSRRHAIFGMEWWTGFFRRLFRSVENSLCTPSTLPARGIHRILIYRPNHRLGHAVLISPFIKDRPR
jgi:hypothetical protein